MIKTPVKTETPELITHAAVGSHLPSFSLVRNKTMNVHALLAKNVFLCVSSRLCGLIEPTEFSTSCGGPEIGRPGEGDNAGRSHTCFNHRGAMIHREEGLDITGFGCGSDALGSSVFIRG